MMPERDFGYYYEDDTYGENGSGEVSAPGDEGSQDKKKEREKNIRFRHNEARYGSVTRIIFISAIAAVLLGAVIYSFDRQNTMYNRVSDKNHELSLVEAENTRLQSDLESRVSAKNVEDYAENVLHMQKIDSSQIKYVKIQEGDVVTIPQQDKGIKAKIKGFFDDLVEYFRG